jgi:hypothetical protein
VWAEQNGYPLEFAANDDLEFRPEMLASYKLVLSVGHDEYWSTPMRDNLEAWIAKGGNVAFFSGNTCCWQVRSEAEGRAFTCFKQNYHLDPVFQTRDFKRSAPRGAITCSSGPRTNSPASASSGAATCAATASSWTATPPSSCIAPTTGSTKAPA